MKIFRILSKEIGEPLKDMGIRFKTKKQVLKEVTRLRSIPEAHSIMYFWDTRGEDNESA